ncbi:ESPR-type extended signal peptide-containing protein [Acinetobacter nosocomialis]|uniref:ESPR-type extended signal peptide-containing protein n=1 Tax=Acinetobacter nosocomialis TaxID=106654 RepID=UPI0024DED2C6|nr:ESPR-type extended signal peptide-containing protein [Acinetobacter nosocomialis]
MNKIYRVIWNASIGAWIAVSEITKSKTKSKSTTVSAVVTVALIGLSGNIFAETGTNGGTGGGTAISNCTGASGTPDGQATTPTGATGSNAIAIGCDSKADENGRILDRNNPYNNSTTANTNGVKWSTDAGYSGSSIAVGSGAESGPLAVALGAYAKATNVASVAVGPAAVSTGNTSLAVGRQSAATADYAQAIGNVAAATGKGTLAIGHSATATGYRAIAIGSPDIDNAGNVGTGQQGNGYQTTGQTKATAKDSIAFGGGAQATQDNALAIGAFSEASGQKSVAIGTGAKATKDNAVVVGENATSDVTGGVALGLGSKVSGDNSAAIGQNSVATAQSGASYLTNVAASATNGTVSVGDVGKERRIQNVADGSLDTDAVNVAQLKKVAAASNTHYVSVNDNGTQGSNYNNDGAKGRNSIAIGVNTAATALDTTAVGSGAQAVGAGSVALGSASQTAGRGEVAIGRNASTKGADGVNSNQSVAIGDQTSAIGDQSVAVGANVISRGNSSVAIGGDDIDKIANDAALSKTYTDITGGVLKAGQYFSTEAGHGATAVGAQAVSTGAFSSAYGMTSKSTGDASSAFGVMSNASGKGAAAFGAVAQATGDGASAMGINSLASGLNSTAIGSGNQPGKGAQATGENAAAIGSTAQATAKDTAAIGAGSIANQENAIAVGKNAQSLVVAGVALGAGSKVDSANSAAIGQNSVATAQKGASYLTNVAASATNGTVSVGDVGKERRIQNVADGALDTDAVNVAQLKSLKGITDQQGTTTAQGLGGGSSYDPTTGTVSAPTYTVNGTPVNNVGAAISELNKGWNLQTNGANAGAVKAGDTVDIGTADGETNLAVAKDGNSIKYSLNKDLTLNSVTAGNTVINNDGLSIANGPSVTTNGIDGGSKVIKNVAAGVDGTDAANVDQLKAASAASKTKLQQGENIVLTKTTNPDGSDNYVVATAKDVNFDKTTVGNVVTDGTTNKITGVEAGTVAADSKDVINGSQLHNTAQSIANNFGGGSVVNPDGTVSAPTYTVNGTPVNNVGAAISELDKGWNLQTNGANAGAVKAGDTVDIGTADGETNLAVAKDGNSIKYSLNKDLTLNSVTAGNTVINNDGLSIANGPSVTTNGIDGGSKVIKNVAAGVDGTDAANVDQLKAASAASKTKLQQGENIVLTKTTNPDGSDSYVVATAKDVNFDKTTVGNVVTDGTTNKITGVEAGTVAADSKDVINGSQLFAQGEGVRNIIGGTTVYNPVTGTYTNTNIGGTGKDNINDAIGAVNTAATQAKSTVTQGNNIVVTQTKNADGSNNYQVETAKEVNFDKTTVGNVVIDSKTNKITGVEAGTVAADSKDVVNGGQLYAQGVGVKDIIGGNTTYDPTTGKYINNDIGGTGENNINDAIGSVRSAATQAKTSVTQGNNIVVTQTKNADGSNNYQVSTAKEVNFDKTTVGNVVIDSKTNKITGVEAGTVSANSKDAVNGSQLYTTNKKFADALGGVSRVDDLGNITGPTYEIGGSSYNNVGDALGALQEASTNNYNALNNKMDQGFYEANKRIDNVQKHANAGIASVLALENAPFVAGKYTYGVGTGFYGGEQAIGATLRKTSDNGRWSLSGGVAGGTTGGASIRVGLSGVID